MSGTIGVVVSEADEASERIGEQLLALREWTAHEDAGRAPADGGGTYHQSGPFELRTFADLHLHLDGVATAFSEPALVVFASRHSGDTGPLLTAHFTGNLGPAEYGGADNDLSAAAPAALDAVVEGFDAHAPEGYEVGIEATHHGPSDVGAPSLFAELGSGPEQWADPAAAEAVARGILALADVPSPGHPAPERTLVGFGGGHYAKRFERVLRETDWTVGHVGADWALADMGSAREHEAVVRQAFEASDAEMALLDGDHPGVAEVVADLGYEVVSETWVRAVEDVALDLAAALEDALVPVDDGLRFGDHARDHDGDFAVVALPDDLLATARGVDHDRTRAAVEEHLLAFETTEGATKAAGRGAVADPGDREALVEALVGVLSTGYDSVERDGDVVVAREEGFDPALAREHGVPEGPKFGALAGGEPVTVDGRTVTPEEVTAERVVELPVRPD